jgi:hypothetical protein
MILMVIIVMVIMHIMIVVVIVMIPDAMVITAARHNATRRIGQKNSQSQQINDDSHVDSPGSSLHPMRKPGNAENPCNYLPSDHFFASVNPSSSSH